MRALGLLTWMTVAWGCSASTTKPCSGVGTYTLSSDADSPPCCKALQHLAIGSAGYADTAETMKVCWSAREGDVSAFSCTQGSCGDGTCEGPEALPCGCALDCPSAVWGPTTASVAQTSLVDDAGAVCSGLGSYTHRADTTTPACCAGLQRLEVRVPYFADNAARVCVQDDALSFACIRGSCGDGTCEAPEALPCLCPPDCPSAVWEQAASKSVD